MGDNEEDRGILCQKRMLKWVVEHVGRLRVCRAGCRYHIRENKRVCGNLTANKDWQRQDEREGMRRTCLSALHFVKSALAAHKCTHVYAHCRVFTSVRCSSALSEKVTPDKSLLQSPATPDLLPKPNNTAEFPHGRVVVVVVQVVIVTQSTFCITWKRCLVFKC